MATALGDLGRVHTVHGIVTYSSGVPSITSNDADIGVTDTGTGDVLVTWGVTWAAAPTIMVSALKGTHSITTHNNVEVETNVVASCNFHWLEHVDASGNTSPDPADDEEIHFVAFGTVTSL